MRLSSLTLVLLLLASSAQARRGPRDAEIDELKRVQDQNSNVLAETVQTLSQARQELQQLRGIVEENSHFLKEQSDKNENLLREFDFRLTGIEERFSLFVEQLEEIRAARGTKKGEGEAADYRKALSAVNLQNYKEAIQLFDQFLAKYPASSLADNAQYWKGETHYALKDYPQAVLQFQTVLKKYPKSNKVPAALLKQGYCFFEMKQYLDAKAFLGKLVTDHPKAEEADDARERLAKIDQLLASGIPPSPPTTAPATAPKAK